LITLVTGASGFIGSHLTRLVVRRGCRVRVLVRPGSRLNPAWLYRRWAARISGRVSTWTVLSCDQ